MFDIEILFVVNLMFLDNPLSSVVFFFFFNDTATTEIYTLSLHDALPILFTSAAGEVVDSPAWIDGPCIPKLVARLIGVDVKRDLAILEVQSSFEAETYLGIEVAPENPKLGEKVTVIGSPGIGGRTWHQNITRGVVSNLAKVKDVTFLKTDAVFWLGNSGGGLFDSKHRLIGVVSRMAMKPLTGVIPGAFYAVAPSEIHAFLSDVDKFFLIR